MSASSTGTFGHSRGAAPRLAIADRPHHDGSPLFTDAGPYALGDRVGIRLRVPAACAAERVVVRTVQDGEPQIISARIDRRAPDATWWAADLTLHNPVTTYRFLLLGGRAGYLWSTAAGVSRHVLTDAADHRLHVGPGAPAWLATTVGYQIFLDRFASSGAATSAPEWAIPCAWDDPVVSSGGIGTRQWFGGDLPGITANLDHLERLGVDLVYLTPFFPARSSHRYDAATFDHVDPLLGGDDALGELIAAAHRRRIRVIGDITLNHTGDHHDWFRRGRADRSNAEAAFYLFDDQLPGGYVSWHGVPSLPKLDHRDAELGRRLYRGPGSIVDRYLRAPFGLDGWRVDCANTTGRFGSTDLNAAVAAATAATARAAGDAWLVAEHCYDPSADLTGAGWHGVMAYQWFTRPLASSWLIGPGERTLMSQTPLPHLDGTDTVASIDHLAGPVAWTARAASMTMLDSHDTPRFRTVVAGDRHRHAVATAALVTMPGGADPVRRLRGRGRRRWHGRVTGAVPVGRVPLGSDPLRDDETSRPRCGARPRRCNAVDALDRRHRRHDHLSARAAG